MKSRQGYLWVIAISAVSISVTISGCNRSYGDTKKTDFSEHFMTVDITKDLHHRMLAGLFVPSKEPVALILMGRVGKERKISPKSGGWVRVSWEDNHFWVKSDNYGRVNVYMNKDTIYGHTFFTCMSESGVTREFFDDPIHPILPRFTTEVPE